MLQRGIPESRSDPGLRNPHAGLLLPGTAFACRDVLHRWGKPAQIRDGPRLHRFCDEPACSALDLKVLPVERVHRFAGVIKIEANQEDPAQTHRSTISDVVHRPAGPICFHVMAKQRSGCTWKRGLIHAVRALSGLGFFMAEATL